MSLTSRSAAGISGWLVVVAMVVAYLAGKYDVSVQDRAHDIRSAAVAATVDLAQGDVDPVAAELHQVLAAAAQTASGPELLAVDRRLAAAEQELPSDYRFTYERAKLAVFGRAEHHEAFHHLKRAAEKAIRTGQAAELLARLEADGARGGPLRRLAVGHREWGILLHALEERDARHLFEISAPPHAAHAAGNEAPPPASRVRDPRAIRRTAFLLLEAGRPCQALAVLQPPGAHARASDLYRSARERCLH